MGVDGLGVLVALVDGSGVELTVTMLDAGADFDALGAELRLDGTVGAGGCELCSVSANGFLATTAFVIAGAAVAGAAGFAGALTGLEATGDFGFAGVVEPAVEGASDLAAAAASAAAAARAFSERLGIGVAFATA